MKRRRRWGERQKSKAGKHLYRLPKKMLYVNQKS